MSEMAALRNLWSRPTWEDRRAHYLAVFERALVLLGEEKKLPTEERELSRRLWFKLLIVCRELDPEERFGRPMGEAKNLLDPKSDAIQTHEEKEPDFQWRYDDPKVSDPQFATRSFTIECKLLGKRGLSRKYVKEGIIRFQHPGWKYGRDLPDGAMIGYIQAMDHDGILAEINDTLRHGAINGLARDDPDWQKGGVSKLMHHFVREFPVELFRLIHFWLDLRSQGDNLQANEIFLEE
uniref:Uncharacterized protein n=1 Tax=Candidatus Kentrum sp. LFY TaxID=2126342 RepID=A0A450UB13_9GAMM|nr:MAG: hypothetical protein BECKLFY1418B_GA0070995_101512 [Candidatus Kentron sp. LFY]